MCYLVYISTDFKGDLSQHNAALLAFGKDFADKDSAVLDLLQYEHLWFVGSKAGCSCTFRHLLSVELGFGEPVKWFPEGADEIEATKLFYDVVSNLISAGYKVDCIQIWNGTKKDQIKRLAVDLEGVSRKSFRFLENHHFIF